MTITAMIALLLWPLITIALFLSMRLAVALPATLIGGYLFLPELVGWDFPVLPRFDKSTIPALMALIMTAILVRKSPGRASETGIRPGWIPKSIMVRVLLIMLAVGAFGTALTNGDVQVFGPRVLPSLRFYDGLSIGLTVFMPLIPFFLARKVLATTDGQQAMLHVLVVYAAGYSLLALWEVRMSPQLNVQIYGYFSHAWSQHVRGGGFRPLVFLHHALWLAIFLAAATIASIGLARASSGRRRGLYIAVAIWLAGTLILGKSLGAVLLVVLFVPIALLVPVRIQAFVAAGFAILVLAYPTLRSAGLVPIQPIYTLAESIDADRARSLQVRLTNEDELLERARERPLFGWGGYDRSRIFDDRGRSETIIDGLWVALFGQGGWMRYLATFGLLTYGIIRTAFDVRRKPDRISVTLALALVASLIDLIPNGGISPLTWLLAGALVGRLEQTSTEETPTVAADVPQQAPRLRRDLTARSSQTHSPVAEPGIGRRPATPYSRASLRGER